MFGMCFPPTLWGASTRAPLAEDLYTSVPTFPGWVKPVGHNAVQNFPVRAFSQLAVGAASLSIVNDGAAMIDRKVNQLRRAGPAQNNVKSLENSST